MIKQYMPIAIIVMIIAIYLFGFTRGHDKCVQQISLKTTETLNQQTIQQRKTDAEIYRTGVRDIRDILRTKYTIAD